MGEPHPHLHWYPSRITYHVSRITHHSGNTMSKQSLNHIFTKPTMSRRYEVWFLKLMLADGSGAWWFRYLLMNLGRADGGGCRNNPRGLPLQAWATWFPRGGEPQSVIQGFEQEGLSLSNQPFEIAFAGNRFDEESCRGALRLTVTRSHGI